MSLVQGEYVKRWEIAQPLPEDVNARLAESKYPMWVRQLLYNRGISDLQSASGYLGGSGSQYDPFLFTGMEKVVQRLLAAIEAKERIVVYGDYDVDGITATALLVQVLKQLGANVDKHIPNRFEEGYGLSVETLEHLRTDQDNPADIILTVDCGIRSPHEVAKAIEFGLEVIISDHHGPHDVLPSAFAVINPKQPGDEYPEKNLAGVGVAYKIASALVTRSGCDHVHVENWLDFVAIGTIADIVPLTGENRSLVKAGLKLLRQGKHKGINALARMASVDITKITARDIGFMIGPRLNAAGRLESANNAYEILVTEDELHAGMLAQQLDDQNRARQTETQRTQERAEEIIQKDGGMGDLLFAVDSDFSLGIVGLAAAKLVEKYYRPAIAGKQDVEFTRASCRSIPEFHITRALDECADLFEHHGGHDMAAGFTIRTDRLDILKNRLLEIAHRELSVQDLCPTIRVDMELDLSMKRSNLMEWLDLFEPYGMSNPEAVFKSSNVEVISCWQVGKDKRHLKLKLRSGMITWDAIAFRQGHWFDKLDKNNKIDKIKKIDIVYSFERNTYNGQETTQLNIRDLRPASTEGDT